MLQWEKDTDSPLSDIMIEYLYDRQEGLRKDYGEEYERLRDRLSRQSDALKKTMTDNQMKLYLEVEDLTTDMYAREDIQTFIRGFKLGVKFMMEIK